MRITISWAYLLGFFVSLAWSWLRALRAGYNNLHYTQKADVQMTVFALSIGWPISLPWRFALDWARRQYQREQTREADRIHATKTLELEERRLQLEERIVDKQLRDQGVL